MFREKATKKEAQRNQSMKTTQQKNHKKKNPITFVRNSGSVTAPFVKCSMI